MFVFAEHTRIIGFGRERSLETLFTSFGFAVSSSGFMRRVG